LLTPQQLSPGPLEKQLPFLAPDSCLNLATAAGSSQLHHNYGELNPSAVGGNDQVPRSLEADTLWEKYALKYWVKARVTEMLAPAKRHDLEKDQLMILVDEVMSKMDLSRGSLRGSEQLVYKYVMKYVCKAVFSSLT
jgi:hypothetical protein